MKVRIIERQQLNYMNAYNAVCEVDGFGTINVLISYCTPVIVTDGETVIALADATCSATTRKHVDIWLKTFAPSYSYQDVKNALEQHAHSTTIVGDSTRCNNKTYGWLYDILQSVGPFTPCKGFYNGLFYVDKGVNPWSRMTC